VLDVLRPGVLEGLTVCVVGDGAAEHLVVDAASEFAEAGGGMAGLRRAVDDGWNVVRAVVTAGWIGDGSQEGGPGGGKVVFLAPIADAGEHANAVGAALENAARTLSVEWARFGVRITAVRPREGAAADERAELVAFLASPAGDYFTGCSFYPGAAV